MTNGYKGRYVWVLPAIENRWLWKPLAHHLGRSLGLTPVLIVRSELDRRFFRDQFGEPFRGEIIVDPDPYALVYDGGIPNCDMAALRKKAAAFERENGLTLIRDLALGERNLMRPYLVGAEGMARSAVQDRATHDLIIQAGITAIEHYEKLFREYPPALVAGNSIGTCMLGKPVSVLCRRHGVPFRNMTHSRFGYRYYWAEDEYENSARVCDFLRSFPTPAEDAVREVQEEMTPTGDFRYYSKLMRRQMRWHHLTYVAARHVATHYYRLLRGYKKTRYTYRPLDTVRNFVRRRTHWKRLSSDRWPRVDDLPDRKIVFFPLQVEPEISLAGIAPQYSNQLALVRDISLNLPSDAVLAVKEHPVQVGTRLWRFYEQIAALANVVLVNVGEHSYPLIRRSALICAVTSSAAHEAAVMGKQVVYFSPNGILHTVPHVHTLDALHDISIITDLLHSYDPDDDAVRARNGARHYLALKQICVDLETEDMFNQDMIPEKAYVARIGDHLLGTLSELGHAA
ncbi:MAG: hypothetical protein QNJ94_13565 [Alphaproteobacteria bacterium]|nr:hypothetical protein [Alphaproteobacteria bacterium]